MDRELADIHTGKWRECTPEEWDAVTAESRRAIALNKRGKWVLVKRIA